MRILPLLVILALCSSIVAADDLFLLTYEMKGGTARFIGAERASGHLPQLFSGGTFSVTDASGNQVAQGYAAIPTAVVMEKFHPDGAIEGDHIPYEGTFTVIAPAVPNAANVIVKDPSGKPLATTDVRNVKAPIIPAADSDPQDFLDLAQGGALTLQYAWVWLLAKILAVIAAAIVGIWFLIKKLRGKKNA